MEGLITRHVGRGTFVGYPTTPPPSLAQLASPMELMDARLAIEPVVAREAALRARKEQVDRLGGFLARSEETDEFELFEDWDIAFHRGLAEATQNPIFIMIMDVMRQMRMQEEWDRLKRSSFSASVLQKYRKQHRAILKAVKARDPGAAAEAMSVHVQLVRTRIGG
jgi:DNA-binding FadR family transcriptional regulator